MILAAGSAVLPAVSQRASGCQTPCQEWLRHCHLFQSSALLACSKRVQQLVSERHHCCFVNLLHCSWFVRSASQFCHACLQQKRAAPCISTPLLLFCQRSALQQTYANCLNKEYDGLSFSASTRLQSLSNISPHRWQSDPYEKDGGHVASMHSCLSHEDIQISSSQHVV